MPSSFTIAQTAPQVFTYSLGDYIQVQIQVFGQGLDNVSISFFNPAGAFSVANLQGASSANLFTLTRKQPILNNLNLASGAQTLTIRAMTLTSPTASTGGNLSFDGLFSDIFGGGGTQVIQSLARWDNPGTGVDSSTNIPSQQRYSYFTGFPADAPPAIVKEFTQTFTVTTEVSGPSREFAKITFRNDLGVFSPGGVQTLSAAQPSLTQGLNMQSGNQTFQLTSLLLTPPTPKVAGTLTLAGSYSNFNGGGFNPINSVVVAVWPITDVNNGPTES